MARLTGFLNPGADADRRRLPGGAGEDRARLRRPLRGRHRQRRAEGLLPARGPHRHDLGGDRRGARPGRDRRRRRPLRRCSATPACKVAQKAKDNYGKLLVAGLTSLILVQATINLFAVMGLAPLTGVPLPFVSYGNSSLLATLFAVGLILNVARGGSARRRALRRGPALANCASSRAGARPAAKGVERAVPGKPRVVVAAGGTAGHVVPAMAVAAELRASGAEVSFLGTRERIEAELVPAAGYEIDFLKVARHRPPQPAARRARPGSRRWAPSAPRGGVLREPRRRRRDGRRRLRRRARPGWPPP